MAKSDSFFIRANVSNDGAAFAQESIDLGAYVDALGKSVLRIHGVYVRVRGANATTLPDPGVDDTDTVFYQLTTQSQSAIVNLTDKSVIASGAYTITNGAGLLTCIEDTLDEGPQMFTNGYLVGVEQIYLGIDCTDAFAAGCDVAVMMECTVETLSQSAAMALALSQQ